MRKIIFILLSVFLISCSDSSTQDTIFEHENAEDYYRFSESEKKRVAPTGIFKAVYLNDVRMFTESLESEAFDFGQKNGDENTVLAVAIKLKRFEMINELLRLAGKADLQTQNENGRGYLSLISEYDLTESYDVLLSSYRAQAQILGELWLNYLDFKDEYGKRASHYAKSAAMMERLEHSWFAGITSFQSYVDSFYYSYDNDGNTFLHTAAKHQRTKVLKWYIDKYCNEKTWEDSSAPGFILRKIGDALADAEWSPTRRRYINRQNDIGDTALHLAAKFGRVRSVTVLQSCYQTDPTIVNVQNRVPIAELVANLDPTVKTVPSTYKEAFKYLYGEVDPTWTRFQFDLFKVGNNFKKLVTKRDEEGWTTIHYAAYLRDPFFWNELTDYQKIEIQTPEGFTPEQLRGAQE